MISNDPNSSKTIHNLSKVDPSQISETNSSMISNPTEVHSYLNTNQANQISSNSITDQLNNEKASKNSDIKPSETKEKKRSQPLQNPSEPTSNPKPQQQEKQQIGRRFRTEMKKWLDVSKYGTFVKGTDILPFKCPLDPKYDQIFEEHERFHWSDIIDFSVQQGTPLKYIIDLTYTTKYYDSKDLPSDIRYMKFWIAGKKLPKEDQVSEIFEIFEKARMEKVGVGIHCTHGRNRTGLLVAMFLIKVLKIDVAEAISRFEEARGCKLEHREYLENLQGNQLDIEKFTADKSKLKTKKETVPQKGMKEAGSKRKTDGKSIMIAVGVSILVSLILKYLFYL